MKKKLALLMVAALMAGVVGCGGGTQQQSAPAQEAPAEEAAEEEAEAPAEEAAEAAGDAAGLKVGICLPARDQYWTTFETGIISQAEAQGIETQTVVADEDFSKQVSQIQTFANNGFDAVIPGITDASSYQEALDASGDMKVVFFNRALTDMSVLDGEKCVYVGMSEYDAGVAQGEWLSNYFKEQGKTELNGVLFMGVLGQESVSNRTAGAKETLEKNGFTVTWGLDDTANWDRTEAMNKFTQYQGSGAEIDLVVCNNDEMALGVIEAITAAGKTVDIPVVGIDATETGCMAVKEGNMAMTVNQNPHFQGTEALACAAGLVNGSLPASVDTATNIDSTPADAITPDNVDEVLAGYGH